MKMYIAKLLFLSQLDAYYSYGWSKGYVAGFKDGQHHPNKPVKSTSVKKTTVKKVATKKPIIKKVQK